MVVFLKCLFIVMAVLPGILSQLEPMNIAAQCSCPLRHPQEKICRADLVIQGRVIEDQDSGDDLHGMGGLLEYTVKVTKVFKAEDPIVQRGKRIIMITSSSAGKCGVTMMDIGEIYLITGLVLEGEIFFSQCEWVQRFKDLTLDQRQSLKNLHYNEGCSSCLIEQEPNLMPGINDNPPLPGNICYHDPLGSGNLMIEDCESMFSVCMREGDGNQCNWSQSKRYGKCVAKRLRRYLAQDGLDKNDRGKDHGHE